MQSHDIEAMLLSPSKAEAMVQVRIGLGLGKGVGLGFRLGLVLGLVLELGLRLGLLSFMKAASGACTAPFPALTLTLTLTLTPTPALTLTPTLTQVYWWAIQTYRRQHPEHQFTLESVQQLVLGLGLGQG